MKILLKCGASAIALLAAGSLTQAEPNEKPGVEREQVKPQQNNKANEPRKTEQKQPAGRAENEQPNKGQRPGQAERSPTPGSPGRAARGDEHAPAQSGRQADRSDEHVPAQSGRQGDGGNEHRQAENAGKRAEGGRARVAIRVTPEQRTRLHDIIGRDTAIHRYHRSEINFSLNVGTRVPDTFEFYDVPPQFIQYDPEFEGYKIIVLDDVVLVVDPETREIVDVIET